MFILIFTDKYTFIPYQGNVSLQQPQTIIESNNSLKCRVVVPSLKQPINNIFEYFVIFNINLLDILCHITRPLKPRTSCFLHEHTYTVSPLLIPEFLTSGNPVACSYYILYLLPNEISYFYEVIRPLGKKTLKMNIYSE